MNRSICSIDETLKGTNAMGQSGPESNGNEGVYHSPKIIPNTRSSFLSYPGHQEGGEFLLCSG